VKTIHKRGKFSSLRGAPSFQSIREKGKQRERERERERKREGKGRKGEQICVLERERVRRGSSGEVRAESAAEL
jgi:hypothetical protein